ncbi:hypothetical protein HYU50_05475 [Candidatus Woesearchaeota archaeon]|nr:hypothetical protein [Candidatus Woesearchaeota archaeon]
MQLIFDIKGKKKLIEDSIKKYGHGVEHNYWNLKYLDGKGTKSVFFEDKGMGIMCINYSGIWEMLPGILAPEEKRLWVLEKFLDCLFAEENPKKVFVQDSVEYRKKIKTMKKYKIPEYSRKFYLPVYNLRDWDRAMPGKKWKKLRNLRNKLYSEHKAEFVPCRNIGKQKLREILHSWKKRRNAADSLWQEQFYDNVLENNFEGIENARSLVVDGIPCTISGGWKIPKSSSYYSALGLLNYKFEGIGEVGVIEEFNLLKGKGYEHVNLGQSDKSLLDFKKKFYPEEIKEEVLFSISKNK